VRTLSSRITLLAVVAYGAAAVLAGLLGARIMQGEVNGDPLAIGLGVAVVAGLLGSTIAASRVAMPMRFVAEAVNDLANGRYREDVMAPGTTPTEEEELVAEAFWALSEKLNEVDASDRHFLMRISHELRTPLTAITGHAQLLQDMGTSGDEMTDRSLDVIQQEATRLNRLIEDILDLAKLRSNRFRTKSEQVDLADIGEGLVGIFRGGEIPVRGDFEHVEFVSDPSRIMQILRNLVGNATRYAQSEIRITGERVRGRVRVTVMNDGEPIPEDQHESIFEPFVGQKREGGMGLGLAISRELSWALGGNLRIVPSDTGTVFELTLPLEPPGSGR
jgi:signal transduction histidine kinase